MKVKMLGMLVLVALLSSFLLGACTPTAAVEPTKAPAKDTAVPATEAPATEAPAAEVTLRWRTRPDNQEEIDVYQAISDEIDAADETVTLVYEPGGSQERTYQEILQTELAAGTAPDVFWIPGADVADFVKRGLVLNLRDMASKTEGYSDADFYPGPMYHLTMDPESLKAGGPLWGLPRDVSTFVLYLNLDLIEEAGADDPRELAANGKWDWAAFQKVAEDVSALGGDIKGYGGSAWWAPYGVWLYGAGGGFFNEDRTACGLDTKESLAGLDFAQKLYTSGAAVKYGEDPEPPFRAGNVGMFQNGRWATPGIRTVEFSWDVVDLPNGPAGKPGNWLFWGAYVVNANTKYPEQSWALVQKLTTAEIQAKVAELGANIPSRVSQDALDAFLTFTPPANNQAFLNGLANDPATEGPMWVGSWPEYSKVMDAQMSSLLSGEETLDDFAAAICGEANKAFEQ